jgi:hypothetical protein
MCAATLVFASGAPLAQSSGAAEGRKPWAEVAAPALVSVGLGAGDPTQITVTFTLVTGTDGADRASVEMMDSSGAVIDSKLLGKSKIDIKTAVFSPPRSVNSEGKALSTDIFIRVESKAVPELKPGGGFDMAGFLALSPKAPAGVGAVLR